MGFQRSKISKMSFSDFHEDSIDFYFDGFSVEKFRNNKQEEFDDFQDKKKKKKNKPKRRRTKTSPSWDY